MVLVERHNWDIGTTAVKGQLTGSKIQFEDGTWKTVKDWYIDFGTNMINVIFEEDSENEPATMFRLSDKFIVKIKEEITPIKKKRFKRHKR